MLDGSLLDIRALRSAHTADDFLEVGGVEVDLGDAIQELFHLIGEFGHQVGAVGFGRDGGLLLRLGLLVQADPELEPAQHEVHHLVVVGLAGDVALDGGEGLDDDGEEHVDEDEGDGDHEEEEEDGSQVAVHRLDVLVVELAQDGRREGLHGVDEAGVVKQVAEIHLVEGQGVGAEEEAEHDAEVD